MTFIELQAQILPVEQLNEVTGVIKDQIEGIRHVKDVNGVLNKYLGTWKGSFNGKEYEINIKKYTRDLSDNVKHFHPEPLLWDQLLFRYKFEDQNGNVVVNTLNDPDEGDYVMPKYKYHNLETYSFIFFGANSKCGDNGYVFLFYQNSTTIHLVYSVRGALYADDCTGNVELTFPANDTVILTKQ